MQRCETVDKANINFVMPAWLCLASPSNKAAAQISSRAAHAGVRYLWCSVVLRQKTCRQSHIESWHVWSFSPTSRATKPIPIRKVDGESFSTARQDAIGSPNFDMLVASKRTDARDAICPGERIHISRLDFPHPEALVRCCMCYQVLADVADMDRLMLQSPDSPRALNAHAAASIDQYVAEVLQTLTPFWMGGHQIPSLRLRATDRYCSKIMAPIAVSDISSSPTGSSTSKASIARYDANDARTTTDLLVSVLERDGGVIVENIISKDLAMQIQSELQPFFDKEYVNDWSLTSLLQAILTRFAAKPIDRDSSPRRHKEPPGCSEDLLAASLWP